LREIKVNKRLLDKNFFIRKKRINADIKSNLNKSLYKKAEDFILKFNVKDSDSDLKYKFIKHFNKYKIRKYYVEVYNFLLKLQNVYSLILLYTSEKKRKRLNRLYFNSIQFFIIIHVEFAYVLTFAFVDKTGQLLNLYFNLGFSENEIYFENVIKQLRKNTSIYNCCDIDTKYLNQLTDIKGRSRNGKAIFKESKENRNNILHRISNLSESNSRDETKIQGFITTIEELLHVCEEIFNLLNNIIVKNGYNISKIY